MLSQSRSCCLCLECVGGCDNSLSKLCTYEFCTACFQFGLVIALYLHLRVCVRVRVCVCVCVVGWVGGCGCGWVGG